ncbi:hypothetical protein V9T40_011732 [Parthenolecanium corni]|uniref:Uncharacterized protein n=1 Tax=Parthenolecanium corni TaxID=536013 RepID=A0AAN9XYF5_9HEMI
MTLADLIRQYLEDRRKHYATKQTCRLEKSSLNLGTREDNDNGLVTIDNKQYFSNDIDPKNHRFGVSPQASLTRQIGVSKSRRVINLPDGSIRIETIIRDSNGNEEKHITTQKGDKKRTIITRKDASGVERREEKITDVNDYDASVPPSAPDNQNDVDNGYDFWFRKFFEPGNSPSNEDPFRHENFPVDFNANTNEQIEKILKKFARGHFFDPYVFQNDVSSKDKDGSGEIPYFDDFPQIDGSLLNEETRKLIENFEKSASSSAKTFTKKNYMSPKQMERLVKSITPAASPSLFEQFADNAMIEIPEEKTPLDRFVTIDEDYTNGVRKIQRERDDAIEKLDKFLSSPATETRCEDIYSDIGDRKDDVECSLILPRRESNAIRHDFGEMFRKAFDTSSLDDGSSQTRMLIENGKKRVESVRKNDRGSTTKTISYEIGNSKYNVIVVTDEFGKVIRRERNFNFPEDELENFKKQWSTSFQSDFEN